VLFIVSWIHPKLSLRDLIRQGEWEAKKIEAIRENSQLKVDKKNTPVNFFAARAKEPIELHRSWIPSQNSRRSRICWA